MSKLIVEVDEGLHKRIGERARMESKTIKEIITGLVENFLGEEGQSEEYQIVQQGESKPDPQPTSPEIERQQENTNENGSRGWAIW